MRYFTDKEKYVEFLKNRTEKEKESAVKSITENKEKFEKLDNLSNEAKYIY